MKSALVLLLTAAPESHEPQLIDVDGTVFVQLGIFLLLMLVLWRFLWKPYLRVRTERVTRVEGYREEAAKLEADAQQRLARADAALAEARRVGAGERAVARAEAHTREQTLLAEANAAAQRKLAEARARLNATLAGRAQASWRRRRREVGDGGGAQDPGPRGGAREAAAAARAVADRRSCWRRRRVGVRRRRRAQRRAGATRGAGEARPARPRASTARRTRRPSLDVKKLGCAAPQLRACWCSSWSSSAGRPSPRRCRRGTSSSRPTSRRRPRRAPRPQARFEQQEKRLAALEQEIAAIARRHQAGGRGREGAPHRDRRGARQAHPRGDRVHHRAAGQGGARTICAARWPPAAVALAEQIVRSRSTPAISSG